MIVNIKFCLREESPERHEFTLTRFNIPEKTVVQSLSCGKEHVLLVTSNGSVFSFGSGSKGQLGIGSLENRSSPTILDAFDSLHIQMVAAGGWHSLALTGELLRIGLSRFLYLFCNGQFIL